jgi:hypothetical protein
MVCMEQTPAIDVVSVGLDSGEVFVHNLKYDETVVSQDWGPVTGIAFRTDGGCWLWLICNNNAVYLQVSQ